eukprot:11454-Heterococcus_DN1.PRE.1
MSTREGTATASGVQDDLALLRTLCTTGIIRAKRAKPAATATADTELHMRLAASSTYWSRAPETLFYAMLIVILRCAACLYHIYAVKQTAADTAKPAQDTGAAAASTAAGTHADNANSGSSSSAVQTWRQHVALLFELLTAAANLGMRSEAVATHIALPLLKTLALMCVDSNTCDTFPPLEPATATTDEMSVVQVVGRDVMASSANAWHPAACWTTLEQSRKAYLARKYCDRWLERLDRELASSRNALPLTGVKHIHACASAAITATAVTVRKLPPLPQHFLWSLLIAPYSESTRLLVSLMLHR